MDRKTRSKLRALYVFEAAIFAYLAGTAVVLRELIAALVPE